MRQTTLAVLSLFAAATTLTGCGGDMVLLNSAGEVARGQSELMMLAIYVMLLVVIPSILMALWFGWKFRKANKDADYQPHWAHSTTVEIVVWGVPLIIIAFLAYITWKGTHEYDPYKPRSADPSQDLVIQVIAEQFKWVFIYPEQNIATVNEVRIPKDQQVSFRITSNFTMTSFFIPKLAGQIYAMAGMQTRLHLSADQLGVYRGIAANYSGYGFSQMRFKAHSVTPPEFEQWVQTIQNGQGSTVVVDDKGTTAIQKGVLDRTEFASLRDGNRAKWQIEAMVKTARTETEIKARDIAVKEGPYPTKPHPVTYYSSVEAGLFDSVINHYMSNPNEAKKHRDNPELHQAHTGGHDEHQADEHAEAVANEATATSTTEEATATAEPAPEGGE